MNKLGIDQERQSARCTLGDFIVKHKQKGKPFSQVSLFAFTAMARLMDSDY